MSIFTRARDPLAEAEAAQARLELARITAQFEREQRQAEADERHRADAKKRAETEQRQAERREKRANTLAAVRTVAPLLLINAGAAYAQALFAYEDVAPDQWPTPSKVAFAIAFSAALESISIYVQWHAHDALLQQAYGAAARLRRAAWVIAAVVGAINFSHFAGENMAPTAAAISFGLLSLLSPWLWGLHTRRAQHVQLLAEDAGALDLAGVDFSPARWRAFPMRSWLARKWSIDHGVTHPQVAWDGFKAERAAIRAAHPNRITSAWRILLGKAPIEPIMVQAPAPAESTTVDLDTDSEAPNTASNPDPNTAETESPNGKIPPGQKANQDDRTKQEKESVVRSLKLVNPKLSQRQLAHLARTSQGVVIRALAELADAPVSAPPADSDTAPETATA